METEIIWNIGMFHSFPEAGNTGGPEGGGAEGGAFRSATLCTQGTVSPRKFDPPACGAMPPSPCALTRAILSPGVCADVCRRRGSGGRGGGGGGDGADAPGSGSPRMRFGHLNLEDLLPAIHEDHHGQEDGMFDAGQARAT